MAEALDVEAEFVEAVCIMKKRMFEYEGKDEGVQQTAEERLKTEFFT